MLTPKELREIADTMYPLLDGLNAWITTDLIKRLMARMERGEDLNFTATDKWQLELYKDAAGHYEALELELKKWLKKSDAEIKKIFEYAGLLAWNADDAFYQTQGFEPLSLLKSESLMRVLTDAYQRTQGEVHNFTRTTARTSEQRFMDVCDTAHLKVMTGAQSYSEAVREAVNELAGGQVRVSYPSGHTDTIETAVLRCVRTGTAQASGNLTLKGMEERNWDVILVSAHLGARYGDGGENPGNHFWWQGKLYSRTGATPGLPLFSLTGYGTGPGLCGWNCIHSFGPGTVGHNPYDGYDSEENKKAFELSQKQRSMEAAIRISKTKLLGLKTAIDVCTDLETKAALQEDYSATALRLGDQNAAYNKFCEDNGLKRYYDRLSVARWNRSEATRAAQAARKATQQKEVDGIAQKIYNEINPSGAAETFGTLPNSVGASTPREKIQGYLLNSNHPVGKNKARVLNSVLGYHYENWSEFSNRIYSAAQKAEVTKIVSTSYGTKYIVPMRIGGKYGKSMILNTVWQIDKGSAVPRIITTTFDKKTIRKEE